LQRGHVGVGVFDVDKASLLAAASARDYLSAFACAADAEVTESLSRHPEPS
jgi:hypothetical protein